MNKPENCHVTTERIDDIVLLLEVMKQIGLPEIINQHLPRHGNEAGLNWGWVSAIWLSYILSQGDHRKVKVREWVNQRKQTIEKVCGIKLRETDFTDDRLGILLKKLSKEQNWTEIEKEISQKSIRVYQLTTETIRIDATTNSGYHQITEEGLFQFGKSKDNPNLAQIKTVIASLDPLGMPLVTKVVSGEKADDRLYIPMIAEIAATLKQQGLLYVGDCKMSSLENRNYIEDSGNYYLCPLARVGQVPQLLSQWIELATSGKLPQVTIVRKDAQGEDKEIAKVYELEREQQTPKKGDNRTWTERILLVRSLSYVESQQRGLQKRLETATSKLMALTPPVGKGKTQIISELELRSLAEQILKKERVEGLLNYDYDYEVPTRYRKGRYQIIKVIPDHDAITQVEALFGWRAFVTNAPTDKLTLERGILTYRDEWIAERSFHRLKGVPLSLSPFFVQKEDQVQGLVHLLSLAIRILTLIEFVVRRRLQSRGEVLTGLDEGNPKKSTQRPTAEKLLSVFKNLNLTLFEIEGQWFGNVTELTCLQKQILSCLGLSDDIYTGLVANST